MRIDFDSNRRNYLEVTKTKDNNVSIVISAQDGNHPLNCIINSAQITLEQFKEIINQIITD